MNYLLQAYKMAIKSILGGKVRSFLTMLGVIIGVASVIIAVSFAQGSTKNITDSISSMGTNLIQVSITGRNSNRNITYDELLNFKDETDGEITAIAPQISGSVTVKAGSKTRSTSLIGTSPEYETIKSVHTESGRFLLSYDVDYRQKVALVGTAVVNDVFEGSSPIGKDIKINGEIFKVVGVLQEKDGGQDQSDDDMVIIPISSAQRLMKSAVIRNFAIQASSPDVIDDVMDKLTTLLTSVYKDTKTFRVFNQEEMLSTLDSVTGTMTAVLAGIAAISLVVGGIGIMNIMLVSVTERTREIGIRKAIGAKKRDVLIQFLIEALMVTGIGGIIGVIIAVMAVKFIIGGFNLAPEVYSVPWMIISFGISLLIGVIFGLFPANKAAGLKPIDALRFE